jgi:type I restriction enzyme M protein
LPLIANISQVLKHDFILTPGRYVGIPDEVDDGIPFAEKLAGFTAELRGQMDEEVKLNEEIKKQLKKVGLEL